MYTRSDQFPDLLYRDVRIDAPVGDERIINLSFSSEIPYKRESFFEDPWIEVLGHKSDEVDLTRLRGGASVHYNHSRQRVDRIGAVLDASVRNGKGHAKIQLSNRDDIEDIWNDVRDGLLLNASVGYRIHERVLLKKNEAGPDEYRVTKWEPMEISLVDIPVDHTVGIGRNVAPIISRPHGTGPLAPASNTIGDNQMTGNSDAAALTEESRQLANQRVVEINELFDGYQDSKDMRALQLRCLNDHNCTIDIARQLALDEIGKNKTASGVGQSQPNEDIHNGIRTSSYGGLADFSSVVSDAMLLRCGVKLENESVHVRDVRSLTLPQIARACVERSGTSTHGWSNMKIVLRALTTSDFDQVLANTGQKLVFDGFRNPERGTHRIWTAEASHRDFKEVSSVAASETPDLELIGEGGEYTYGKLMDTGDKIALRKYGKILRFSMEAIVNDDLGELETAARSFGDSAVRLEANLCYAVLTTNPVMYDGTVLFHTDHNNIGTAAVPTVASLGEARKLMRQQMGLNNASFLDPPPFALIVNSELETSAEQLLSSIYDPAGSIQATTTPEFVRRLTLVAEPRLDADSATQWYLTANPRAFSWIKRIYLDGNTEPFTDEQTRFDRDEWEIKVRHFFAAKAYMWQGAVRNAGV